MGPDIQGMHHVKLPCHNLLETVEFYTKIFPFTHIKQFDHFTPPPSQKHYACIMQHQPSSLLLEARLNPKQATAQKGWDPITWSVASKHDLDQWAAWFDQHGVKRSKVFTALKAWVLVAEDPDGKFVRLQCEEEHEWYSNPDQDSYWLDLNISNAAPEKTAKKFNNGFIPGDYEMFNSSSTSFTNASNAHLAISGRTQLDVSNFLCQWFGSILAIKASREILDQRSFDDGKIITYRSLDSSLFFTSRLVLCKTQKPVSVRFFASASDTTNHRDLDSFLEYASRTNLSQESTVYVGTHYEYTVMQSLSRLGFNLSRTGGRLDGGIDLVGIWSAPTLPADAPMHVLLQCKALSRKPGPNLIRELEGAFAAAPALWRRSEKGSESRDDNRDFGSSGVMAILVASKEATKGVRDTIGKSRWPMGYAKITLEGNVEQLVWNKSAASKGLEGLGVSKKFLPPNPGSNENAHVADSVKEEVVLTFAGDVWDPKESPDVR